MTVCDEDGIFLGPSGLRLPAAQGVWCEIRRKGKYQNGLRADDPGRRWFSGEKQREDAAVRRTGWSCGALDLGGPRRARPPSFTGLPGAGRAELAPAAARDAAQITPRASLAPPDRLTGPLGDDRRRTMLTPCARPLLQQGVAHRTPRASCTRPASEHCPGGAAGVCRLGGCGCMACVPPACWWRPAARAGSADRARLAVLSARWRARCSSPWCAARPRAAAGIAPTP